MLRTLVFHTNRLIASVSRAIWRRCPISSSHKETLKGFAFGRFGLLFRGTAAYRIWRFSNFPTNQPVWKDPLSGGFHQLAFEASTEPIVSVIIPFYNSIECIACLGTIKKSRPQVPFEIIAVDDGSTDETSGLISKIGGVRYIRDSQNIGIMRSYNLGASIARGKYLIFLKNDTQVALAWMDELVQTINTAMDVGLIGSKLFFPDGRLREAGAIVWKDGSVWHCGRGDDLDKPEYNYLREVDYCSSASALVRADLFGEVGGFDERYIPAYYRDADLAFKIRARGYRVLYQPMSQVIHAESPHSETKDTPGARGFQIANRSKFTTKWTAELSTHGKPRRGSLLARERGVGKRVLLVDWNTPTPDQDAGSVITFEFIRLFQRLSYKVTFIPENFLYNGRYTAALQRMGVECIYRPFSTSVKAYIRRIGKVYDVIVVFRASLGHKYLDDFRRYCPNARIILHTIDLYYLREERRAELEKSDAVRKLAKELRAIELEAMRKSDCTIVVSNYEHELVTTQIPEAYVAIFPLVLQARREVVSFRDRRDILFLGDFRHPPNVDAVLHFVSAIWPRVRAVVPQMKFYVVGGSPPKEIADLGGGSVVVTGRVEDLSDCFNHVRLSVAPLRYGAGIKGKIGTSLSFGLPCVASPIAVEGMGLTDGLNVLVGEDPRDFAEDVLGLYQNEGLWTAISANGIAFVQENYSFDVAAKRLSTILEGIRT